MYIAEDKIEEMEKLLKELEQRPQGGGGISEEALEDYMKKGDFADFLKRLEKCEKKAKKAKDMSKKLEKKYKKWKP